MTAEQFKELESYKEVWEYFDNSGTITERFAAQMNGLNDFLHKTTGNSFDMNCSSCKSDMLRFAQNLYLNNKQHGKADKAKGGKK